MLNYVAGLVLTYLIIDSHSYWRDTESFEGQTFPLSKTLPGGGQWPARTLGIAPGDLVVPLGFGLAIVRRRRSCGSSTGARASASSCR